MDRRVEYKKTERTQYVHYFDADRESELSIVQCGHQTSTPGYCYGPLIRDHHLLHVIVEGKGKFYLNNQIYELHTGDCFLIYPHQIGYYEADTEDPWKYCWVGFCGYQAEASLAPVRFGAEQVVGISPVEPVVAHILRMLDYAFTERGTQVQQLLLGGLLRELLYRMAASSSPIWDRFLHMGRYDANNLYGGGKYDDEYVNIVVNIIQSSYTEDIRVEKIAEKLCLNRSYLSSVFKTHTGQSIKRYLTYFRIEQSLPLLKDDKKNIAEVALLTGFSDPLYFSRAFKKEKKCSPTQYRKSVLSVL